MENHNTYYNNADSFSMIFDEAWAKNKFGPDQKLTVEEKIEKIIEDNKEHPFVKSSPSQAINVARFRLKLLQLE